jgi:hypothetical protein
VGVVVIEEIAVKPVNVDQVGLIGKAHGGPFESQGMPGGEPIKVPPEALCYLFIVLISKRTGIFQQIVRFCAWASVML